MENFSEEKEKELEKVVKQIEQWEAARMDYRQMHVVAKKIASILADNEALVSDLTDIFKIVKGYLTVTIDSIPKRPSLAFGSKIVIPDKTNDSDGIWDE